MYVRATACFGLIIIAEHLLAYWNSQLFCLHAPSCRHHSHATGMRPNYKQPDIRSFKSVYRLLHILSITWLPCLKLRHHLFVLFPIFVDGCQTHCKADRPGPLSVSETLLSVHIGLVPENSEILGAVVNLSSCVVNWSFTFRTRARWWVLGCISNA